MSEDEQINEGVNEGVNEAEQGATQADAPTPAATSGDGAATDTSAASTATTDGADARIADLERKLAAERDAATDYMQKWQRAVADFANFKRRAQQEQEQRDRLFTAQALAPVLNALDSLERAFTALPDTLRSYTWIEGVALVDYQLRHALEMQGVAEVAATPGQPFDPTQHQAVGEVETDQHPAGHIAVVLQRGYTSGSVLVRPALVQVARAPQTPSREPEDSSAPEAPNETQPSGPAP